MKPIVKTDNDYLSECLLLIEQKLNWGRASDWNNQDFLSLGEKIFEKTGVKLSHTTLKRVWGKVKYESFPQTSTLNALAAFLGFENWQNFKASNAPATSNGKGGNGYPEDSGISLTSRPSTAGKRQRNLRIWQSVFFLSILAFIIISVLNYPRDPGLTDKVLESIEFSSEKVAEGIPNTVVFNYDVSKVRATMFEIQQSWDERKRFEISPLETVATSTYYLPGYFRAKLLVDKQVVREHDLFIKSGGWLTTIESGRTPRYLKGDELVRDSSLAVSGEVLSDISNSRSELPWLGFHYVEDMGNIEADNFTFEASVRNTYEKGDGICRESRIYLLGTEGAIGIPLAIPGCAGNLRLMFRDIIQDGKTHDLSAFGTEYDGFQVLKVHVEDKLASIFLNNEMIRQIPYNEPAGQLAGFRIKFKGAGEIDFVKIKDGEGNLVFEENFD